MAVEGKNTRQRIKWLDNLKTCAIMLVVIIHAIELVYIPGKTNWMDIGATERLAVTFLFSMGRLAVPLFLFVSGYLLLNKVYDSDESCLSFYKMKLLPLVKQSFFWLILYILFDVFYLKTDMSKGAILRQLLFMENPSVTSFWYIPMLISLYLMYPFIATLLNKYTFKSLKYVFLVGVLNFLIMPSINRVLSFSGVAAFPAIKIQPILLNGLYGLFAISGFYFKKEYFEKISEKKAFMLLFVSVTVITLTQSYSWLVEKPYWIWYDSIIVYVGAMGLFFLIKNMKISKISNILSEKIAPITLSIYFIHFPVQLILKKSIMIDNRGVLLVTLIVGSLIGSFSLIWLKNVIKNFKIKKLEGK